MRYLSKKQHEKTEESITMADLDALKNDLTELIYKQMKRGNIPQTPTRSVRPVSSPRQAGDYSQPSQMAMLSPHAQHIMQTVPQTPQMPGSPTQPIPVYFSPSPPLAPSNPQIYSAPQLPQNLQMFSAPTSQNQMFSQQAMQNQQMFSPQGSQNQMFMPPMPQQQGSQNQMSQQGSQNQVFYPPPPPPLPQGSQQVLPQPPQNYGSSHNTQI